MKKFGIFQNLKKAAELDAEPFPRKPLVEILDNRCVLVENHFGVISYSGQEINIKTKNGKISVKGVDLQLIKISREQLKLTGNVCCIEIHGGEPI